MSEKDVPAPEQPGVTLHSQLRVVAEVLDDLDVGMCVFNAADEAMVWNRTFLRFFPEHKGHVHRGEPYAANLRRFYTGRLSADEMPFIERYIQEGIARHHAQQAPYSFEHRGQVLRVASLPLPGGPRIRVWNLASQQPVSLDGLLAAAEPAPGDGADAAQLPLEGVRLFEYVADGMMVTGADSRVLWINERCVAMYALPDRTSVLGMRFEEMYTRAWSQAGGEERDRYATGRSLLAERMRFSGAPFEVPLPGGRWVRVIEQRSPQSWGFFSHVDITVLKQQQHQLELAEQRARESEARLREKSTLLEATLERMNQGIMMISPDLIVEVCNRRAVELLELPPDLMASKPPFAEVLAHQWGKGEFVNTPDNVLDFIRAGSLLDGPLCYDRKRPDGRVIEVQSVPIEGGGVLRSYSDITERKRQEERIHHVARHDGLTSLVNREAFLELLANAAQIAEKSGKGFAVHYLDLDEFKAVNDTHGHATGDRLLATVASRMRAIARDADVVARMGGDEFAILQLGVDGRDAAIGLARRIHEGVIEPIPIDTLVLQVGVSIGIALWPADGVVMQGLLRKADEAMYRAKSSRGEAMCLAGDAIWTSLGR